MVQCDTKLKERCGRLTKVKSGVAERMHVREGVASIMKDELQGLV